MKTILFLTCLVLVAWGCGDDTPPPSGGGNDGLTSTFPNNAVSMHTGDTASAGLAGGTPPYAITTLPNPNVATGFISNDSIHITGIGGGSTSLTISDASPGAGDGFAARTLAISITVSGHPAITVNGFVRDFAGEPIYGAVVLIPNKQPVGTGTDGSFSIPGVAAPYDATFTLNSMKWSFTYKGLTRSDPTLHSVNLFFSAVFTATVSGSVPPAIGSVTQIAFASGDKSWRTTANPTSGSYTINVSWRGTVITLTGNIHVLRWVDVGGPPATYDAYGLREQTVTAGSSHSGVNFAAGQLTDPMEMNISGSVSRPSGSYSLNSRELYIGFGSSVTLLATETGTIGENLSYTVPSVPGATFGIAARGSYSGSEVFFYRGGIAAGTQNVTVSLEEAPHLVLPADGETGVDTTTVFEVQQGGGVGVNFVLLQGTGTDPTFMVVTDSNSFRIPTVNQPGFALPSGRAYSWRVIRVFPISSMDEAASSQLVRRYNGNLGDIGVGRSETFGFTTRP